MASNRGLERICSMEYEFTKSRTLFGLCLFVALLASQNCKSLDGIYTGLPSSQDRGKKQYVQIMEYDGRIYVQEGYSSFSQFKNAEELEQLPAYKNTLSMKKEMHPDLPILTTQIKKGIGFVPLKNSSEQKRGLGKFRILGPFIESTSEKNGNSGCERFTFVMGTVSEFVPSYDKADKSDKIGIRAYASRHSDLGVCGAKLENGQKYEANDSAFGGVFILDDDRKVVGVMLLGYMYAEFFIAEGYPAEKAMRFMKKESGTAESVFE